jgi:uncharacterized protein YndB with AHSA1/START domain
MTSISTPSPHREAFSAATQVDLPNDLEVRVTRRFAAPRDLVYRAYTTPALLTRWMLGPPGWSMPVCDMDVRVGGAYRWRWRSHDGAQEFGFHGEFVEVVPGQRLVHTEVYDPGTVGGTMGSAAMTVTVTFADAGDGTGVTTLMRFATQGDRDAALATGMTDGMEMSYRLLDALTATSTYTKPRRS